MHIVSSTVSHIKQALATFALINMAFICSVEPVRFLGIKRVAMTMSTWQPTGSVFSFSFFIVNHVKKGGPFKKWSQNQKSRHRTEKSQSFGESMVPETQRKGKRAYWKLSGKPRWRPQRSEGHSNVGVLLGRPSAAGDLLLISLLFRWTGCTAISTGAERWWAAAFCCWPLLM